MRFGICQVCQFVKQIKKLEFVERSIKIQRILNLRQKLQFCSGMNIKSFIEGCVSFQASEPTELENPGRNFLSAIKQAGRLQVKDLPEGVSLVKTVVKMK